MCWLQETVVLDSKAAKAATAEILEAHSIPLDVSADLKSLSAFPSGRAPQPSKDSSSDDDNIAFAGL